MLHKESLIAGRGLDSNHCNTHNPGYMLENHPTEIGRTISATVCFQKDDCGKDINNVDIEVTKCGPHFFVYNLPDTPHFVEKAPTQRRFCSSSVLY